MKIFGLHEFGLFCLLLAVMPLVAWSAEPAKLPDDVDRFLKWLPADTESLHVARSFELGRRLEGPVEAVSTGLKPFFFLTALGDFYVIENRTPLPQRKIKLAVCGGRNAEIVSAFGSMRKECCAIIVLEKPLDGDADKWKDALRAKAEKTTTIVDQQVFVFPSLTVMEGVYKQKEWRERTWRC